MRMPIPQHHPAAAPGLVRQAHPIRLWLPDDHGDDAETSGPQLSAAMSLCTVYRTWFRPVVLGAQRNSKPGTTTEYDTSLEKWEEFTGDPPLFEVDGNDYVVAQFLNGLRTGTYKRGPTSVERPYSANTIAKHINQVDAVLKLMGPRVDRKRPYKGLIEEVPYLCGTRPRSVPKDPIELDVARRLYAACTDMVTPGSWSEPAKRWAGLLSVLYYVGLRIGTATELRPQWLVAKGNDDWFQIPGQVVKRNKPLMKFVRRECVEALERIPHEGKPYFAGQRFDYLRDRHERLQKLAGVRPLVGFHAWRRTHGVQMALAGAKAGIKAAQFALDHEDDETTSDHYVDIQAELVQRLPPLDVAPRGFDPNQKTLF